MKRKPNIENLRLSIRLLDNPETLEIGIYTFIHELEKFDPALYGSTSFSIGESVYCRPVVETASGQMVLTWETRDGNEGSPKRAKSPRSEAFFTEAARNLTGEIEASLAQEKARREEGKQTGWVQQELRLAEERKQEAAL